MSHSIRVDDRRLRQPLWAAALVLAVTTATAEPLTFAPLYGSEVATAAGADAVFRRIDNAWQGSQVLWDEAAKQYGSGQPIGSFAWGTGLWGRADWSLVMSGAVPAVQNWAGAVDQINYGNARYNECYAGTWGSAALLPFFADAKTGVDCADAEAGVAEQQNWAARFSGFIRITDPGLYNFSVLYDDGFFFRLIGEGQQTLDLEQDFLNPRDRQGFGNNLMLSAGLYGFELGSWNRLGAGVVDLRWSRGDDNWTLVPTENLARPQPDGGTAVPEPTVPALLAMGLMAAMAVRRRVTR